MVGAGAKTALVTLDDATPEAVAPIVADVRLAPSYVAVTVVSGDVTDVVESFNFPDASEFVSVIGLLYACDPLIVFPAASFAVTDTATVVAVPAFGFGELSAITMLETVGSVVSVVTASTYAVPGDNVTGEEAGICSVNDALPFDDVTGPTTSYCQPCPGT